jgi:hypothetical protein
MSLLLLTGRRDSGDQPIPPGTNLRITADGNDRITSDGDLRIVPQVFYEESNTINIISNIRKMMGLDDK